MVDVPPDFKKDLWSQTKPEIESTRSWETKPPVKLTTPTVKSEYKGKKTVLPSPMEWEFPASEPPKMSA